MKPNELKAWLEGFKEGMKGAPTKAQWDKINKKIDELDDEVTYRYYRDWYWTHPWDTFVSGEFQTLTTSTPEITWTTGDATTANSISGVDFYQQGLNAATSEHKQ